MNAIESWSDVQKNASLILEEVAYGILVVYVPVTKHPYIFTYMYIYIHFYFIFLKLKNDNYSIPADRNY